MKKFTRLNSQRSQAVVNLYDEVPDSPVKLRLEMDASFASYLKKKFRSNSGHVVIGDFGGEHLHINFDIFWSARADVYQALKEFGYVEEVAS